MHLDAQQRQQVTRDEVINVALTRLTGSNARTENRLRGLTVSAKCDSAENALLYEVATDSVSLLLSGSKACYPILGKYTTHHGPLLNRYDSLPGGLRTFLDGYVQQMAFCFERDTIGLYYQDVWDSLIGGISLVRRDRNFIGPLMSTRWDQKYCNGSINIGYEYDMPSGDTCEHCVAGCVAVAMGQVMNYWKHPVDMGWDMQFDWCNMSDKLDVNSPTFFQNRSAISELLHDCGVKVNMDYHCEGSGAQFDSIKPALVNNYGYSDDAEYVSKSGMSDGDWMSLLKQQIDMQRPVIYSACGGQCHSFVCDGYGDDIYFTFALI